MHRTTRPRLPHLWSVVLAAGASSRLGQAKQLIRIRQRSLLIKAIEAAEAHTPKRVIVVIGAHAGRLRAHLRRHYPRVIVVYNGRWREGMGRSLGTGVCELPAEARGVLVLLTDQPKVGPAVLGKLVHAWRRRPTRVMAAAYGGQLGVPAIFPRAAFRAFRQIEGDTGARRMLRKGGNVDSIDVPEAAFDVDTPADVSNL